MGEAAAEAYPPCVPAEVTGTGRWAYGRSTPGHEAMEAPAAASRLARPRLRRR